MNGIMTEQSQALLTPDTSEVAQLPLLRDAIAAGRVALAIDRRKLDSIDFPLSVEADGNRWVYLLVGLSILAFWQLGWEIGCGCFVASFLIYQTLGRAHVAKKLRNRICAEGMKDIATWRKVWRFGGVILSRPGDKGVSFQGPDQDWRQVLLENAPH